MLVLKQQLKEARIPQAVVARAVAVSEATLAQIVNHNEWPRTSPEEVRQRLASWLESQGIDTAKSFDAAQGAVTPRTAGTTDKTNLSEEENMLLKKQVLFPATKKAFGLFRDPFADEAMQGADDVFTTPDIRYVREALFQTARHGGFLAVIGESGAGKRQRDLQQLRRCSADHHPRAGNPDLRARAADCQRPDRRVRHRVVGRRERQPAGHHQRCFSGGQRGPA